MKRPFTVLTTVMASLFVAAASMTPVSGQIVPEDDARLNITFNGSGYGSVSVNGGGCYSRSGCQIVASTGRPITVEAFPAAGSRFGAWLGGPCANQGRVCTMFASAGANAVPVQFDVDASPGAGMTFIPASTCRVLDTRNDSQFGRALAPLETRVFQLAKGPCAFPSGTAAVSVNITVVPTGPLSYITVYPAGAAEPLVSTLNSLDGRIKANAAIVPVTGNAAMALYSTSATDVIIDVNGFFVPSGTTNSVSFYSLAPCRILDTRGPTGTFGGPFLGRLQTRQIPVASSTCGIPGDARAYSLNVTAVPRGPLPFLTVWETGAPLPQVSTLNSLNGGIVANAAIVPAGLNGAVDFYATGDTDLVVDINGYFGPTGQSQPLVFSPVLPCRATDTRNAPGVFGGPAFPRTQARDYPFSTSVCATPANAQSYSLNATVVPSEPFSYLTLWPSGIPMPTVSTLNALDGAIASNAAIVPAGFNGAISAFATNSTHLILDINGYFFPRPAQ